MRIFWVFLLLSVVGIFGWIKFKPEIPFAWTLVSNDGIKLPCTIIGKNETLLTILRESDGQRFEMAKSRLGLRDRLFLMSVKNSEAPPVIRKKLSDPYIERRKEEITKLKKEIEILDIQIKSQTLDPIVVKTRAEQLLNKQKEIRVLETAIQTHDLEKKL